MCLGSLYAEFVSFNGWIIKAYMDCLLRFAFTRSM